MVRQFTCDEQFSFEDAFGEAVKFERFFHEVDEQREFEHERCETKEQTNERLDQDCCSKADKKFTLKNLLKQRTRLTGDLPKLFCNVNIFSGVNTEEVNLAQNQSTRSFSRDIFGSKSNGSNSEAVSMTLKSFGLTEEDDESVNIMRQDSRYIGSRSFGESVKCRKNVGQTHAKDWFLVRNNSIDQHDGVMHAVFFDTVTEELYASESEAEYSA